MQAHRIVLGLSMIGTVIAAPGLAFAEDYRGTMEQQLACTPDVWRLCSDRIPDVNRIVTCLRQNTPQLSDGCRAVFESNDSAQQQPAPRDGARQPRPGDDDDDK